VFELVDPKWQGKCCLANPLFGTTAMHAAALFQALDEAKAREFFQAMKGNGVAVLSSNGEVKRRVAAGDFAFGLTDTDDANVAIKEGKPIGIIFPDQDGMGTLIVPNCAVLIAGAPHADNGRKFIDYLLTPEVEQALAESDAAQMPVRKGVKVPPNIRPLDEIKPMQVDYEKLAAQLEELSRGFLKSWVSTR
jgi:iron(III) transport system substrate-binding protein